MMELTNNMIQWKMYGWEKPSLKKTAAAKLVHGSCRSNLADSGFIWHLCKTWLTKECAVTNGSIPGQASWLMESACRGLYFLCPKACSHIFSQQNSAQWQKRQGWTTGALLFTSHVLAAGPQSSTCCQTSHIKHPPKDCTGVRVKVVVGSSQGSRLLGV